MKRLMFLFCLAVAACSPVNDDTVNRAKDSIERDLKGNGIYERGNLPEDLDSDQLKGYFDIVRGAYRYVVNEDRDGRGELPIVEDDSVIEVFFDARIYKSNFESSTTFYTNIEARLAALAGGNPEFDPSAWPTLPLRIALPDDSNILKSVQRALVGCRAASERIIVDDEGNQTNEKLAGDVVRVYLTPDIGFGDTRVNNVPAGSTLVFEVTEIKVVE